jgi:hypothetical protein
MLTPSFAFKNNAPISASDALATTMRRIVDKVSIDPLCCCSPFLGFELINKFPAALLHASCFWFVQVPSIGVDIQDHVAGAVVDCRVGVGCAIVEELDEFCFGVFH